MAIYDRNEERIIVRVVYDGLGNAGKSTNLRELCNVFTLRRRSELYVPEERDGRTLYFDWLQIESGLVGGHRLRCQVMSVPGQLVLRERRARLLRTADVIVLVCDSTREGVERASKGFARTRAFMAEHVGKDVMFIIQANKQDLPNALSVAEIAESLGAGEEVKIVAARANEGVGVRETAVLAIRAAADRVQKILLEQGLELIAGEAQSPESLYHEMRQAELGSSDNLSLDALLDEDDVPPTLVPNASPQVISLAPPSLAVARADVADPLPRFESLAPTATRAALEPAVSELPPPEASQLIDAIVSGTLAWPPPPTETRKVPSGLIWPSATGRDTLRLFEHKSPRPISDRVAQTGSMDGSGKAGFVLYELEGTCFKTNQTRLYSTIEAARDALVDLVRNKMILGTLAPKGTVLAVYEEDESYRLWTMAPWYTTLSSRLHTARRLRDETALGEVLADFAEVVVDALVVRARQELLLDVHPSNFAREDGQTVYLDDELKRGGSVYPIVHALLQRVEEHAEFTFAIERYLGALQSAISARLSSGDLSSLELLQQLIEIQPRAQAAEVARTRLTSFVRQAFRLQAATQVPEPAPPHPQPFAMAASVVPTAPLTHRPPPRAVTPRVSFESAERTAEYLIRSEPPPLPEVKCEVRQQQALQVAAADGFNPPLPRNADDLPSGYIWPAAIGRELVKRMSSTEPVRTQLQGSHAEAAQTYEIGEYRLTTSLAERFDDPDEGRAELLKRARAQVLLAGLATATTVLVLVPSTSDGSHWLWTIEPNSPQTQA